MQKVDGVSNAELLEMRAWLLKKRITFEFTRSEYDRSITISLIDYTNRCLVVSKEYVNADIFMDHKGMERLVKEFEREEVYPILFNLKTGNKKPLPTIRLIREN